jgi:hypothetical protein
MSPLIESDPGKQLHEVWISLSPEEAVALTERSTPGQRMMCPQGLP